MGVAHSDNVAQAITNISNYVTNSTSADQTQVNQISQKVNLDQCKLIATDGDFTTDMVANCRQVSSQISNAKSSTSLDNNVQQKMLQEATSKVGTLGIGYASASNSTNQMVNLTNSIKNIIQNVSDQYSDTKQEFNCTNSFIQAKNIKLNFSNTSDFMNTQVLNNDNVTKITNEVLQESDQKATATVEGIGSLLLIIAICIGIIIWSFGKTLDTAPVKMGIAGLGAFLVVSLFAWSYVGKKPPFFNDADACIKGSDMGLGTGKDKGSCINYKISPLQLDKAPLRYFYDLVPVSNNINLFQMVIAKFASGNGNTAGNNGGYRIDVMISLQNAIDQLQNNLQSLGLQTYQDFPNPLIDPIVGADSRRNSSNIYQIPINFLLEKIEGTTAGKCTPQSVQVDNRENHGSKDGCDPQLGYNLFDVIPLHPDNITDNSSLGVANLNMSGINNFISDPVKARYARFILCTLLGNIDTSIYIFDDELVQFRKDNGDVVIGIAGQNQNENIHHFSPDTIQSDKTLSRKIDNGGILEGQIGVVNNNTYKFHNFMQKIGYWLFLVFVIFAIGLPVYKLFFKKEKKDE
jgi:hypothetical protein